MDYDDSMISAETEFVAAAIADSEGERPDFYNVMELMLTVQSQAESAKRLVDWTSIEIFFDEEDERWTLTVSLEPVGF